MSTQLRRPVGDSSCRRVEGQTWQQCESAICSEAHHYDHKKTLAKHCESQGEFFTHQLRILLLEARLIVSNEFQPCFHVLADNVDDVFISEAAKNRKPFCFPHVSLSMLAYPNLCDRCRWTGNNQPKSICVICATSRNERLMQCRPGGINRHAPSESLIMSYYSSCVMLCERLSTCKLFI